MNTPSRTSHLANTSSPTIRFWILWKGCFKNFYWTCCQHISDKISWCQQMRSASPPQPTVPSTIAEEHLINPFMRVIHRCLSKHSSFLKMASYPRLLSQVYRRTQARVNLWRPCGLSGLRRITSRANNEWYCYAGIWKQNLKYNTKYITTFWLWFLWHLIWLRLDKKWSRFESTQYPVCQNLKLFDIWLIWIFCRTISKKL